MIKLRWLICRAINLHVTVGVGRGGRALCRQPDERGPMTRFLCVLALLCGCGDDSSGGTADAAVDGSGGNPDASSTRHVLTVSPSQLTVRSHMGAGGEPAFHYDFTAPTDLAGGGLPASLTNGQGNLAVLELELPQGFGSTDEAAMVSTGLRSFSAPLFCMVGAASCANAGMDGNWKATVLAKDGSMREVQLGRSEVDLIASRGAYHPVFGVFLPATDSIKRGDVVRFDFIGKLPGSA